MLWKKYQQRWKEENEHSCVKWCQYSTGPDNRLIWGKQCLILYQLKQMMNLTSFCTLHSYFRIINWLINWFFVNISKSCLDHVLWRRVKLDMCLPVLEAMIPVWKVWDQLIFNYLVVLFTLSWLSDAV